MSDPEVLVTLRTGDTGIGVNAYVALASNTRKRGYLVAMPHPGDPNRMVSVLFEDEDEPRPVRLVDVRAVAAAVQIHPSGNALVIYYATGVSTNGTPGNLGVWVYGNGNVSVSCDGWPVGGAEDILPRYLRRFGRQGEHAEAAALWALGRLCVTASSIFADHAMSVAALREFVKTRAAELNIVTP